jgi:hypothetical protein
MRWRSPILETMIRPSSANVRRHSGSRGVLLTMPQCGTTLGVGPPQPQTHELRNPTIRVHPFGLVASVLDAVTSWGGFPRSVRAYDGADLEDARFETHFWCRPTVFVAMQKRSLRSGSALLVLGFAIRPEHVRRSSGTVDARRVNGHVQCDENWGRVD